MLLLGTFGVLSLAFGVLILLAPDIIRAWSNALDRVLITFDEKMEKYKVSMGIIATATGAVALFLIYMIKAKQSL